MNTVLMHTYMTLLLIPKTLTKHACVHCCYCYAHRLASLVLVALVLVALMNTLTN